MDQFTKESGKIINIMAMESTSFPMGPSTKENGRITFFMELASLSMPQDENGKENSVKESLRAGGRWS
jgi:hypothetical protein